MVAKIATIPISPKDGQGQVLGGGLKLLELAGESLVRDDIAGQSPKREQFGTDEEGDKETTIHGTYLILVQGTDVRTGLCLVRFAHFKLLLAIVALYCDYQCVFAHHVFQSCDWRHN
jgi:hypothetical protein